MAGFSLVNAGIASGIVYKIEFSDYTGEELYRIFLSMCERGGRICLPDVSAELGEIFRAVFGLVGN